MKVKMTRLLCLFLALLVVSVGALSACGDDQTTPDDPVQGDTPDTPDTPDEPDTPDTPATPGVPDTSGISKTEVTLTNDQLYDKMAGSWVGQMIGVTWSASTEFRYNSVIIPEGEVPVWTPTMVNDAFGQDDLYVEVPFIDAMKDKGVMATIDEIAPYFRDSKFGLAHANYQGRVNLQMGIEPALAGHYKYNYHADDIDWQIEADFLGNIFPGMPSLAAQRAFEIGHLVNYGDGVYGGVFVSAMHAAAFGTNDLDTIIRIGIESVPKGTEFRAVCDQVVACYEEGMTWEECWHAIEEDWATDDKCPEFQGANNIDAKINAAYILIGLLWGEGDLADTIVISMRCGQDSDCNPSSAAAILGTMYGLSGLPEEYKSAVDYNGAKFAYTEYTLDDCIDLNLTLAKQALQGAGVNEKDGKWTFAAEQGVVPVAYEQWPDDELTVYMTLSPRSTGEVQVKTACVPPAGYKASDVTYSYDMGDGTVLNASITSYTYLQPGTYTIKCTAEVGDYTATVEQTIDMSDIKGDRGFKVKGLCSEMAPQGGGSRDIGVICDGEIPSVVGAQLTQQYDTFGGEYLGKDWFGLKFDHGVKLTEVLFTEGAHFENGGWFQKTPTVEVLMEDGNWSEIYTECSPLYMEVDAQSAQGDPYQTFTFTFAHGETPYYCYGVRVVGEPGGSSQFASCAELDVNFSEVKDPTYEGVNPSDPVGSAIIIVSESNPAGAGCKDIELIRDGKSAAVGSYGNHATEQYDTFTGRSDDHEEFYGYIFRGEVDVTSVTFTEGCHFDNGGWFKDGTLRLELMIDGEWEEADATLSPKYPKGDSMGTFGGNYQSYTFALVDALTCSGVRVIGMAGGSAHFTSVSELAVEVLND